MATEYLNQINETFDYIQSKTNIEPEIGIILGTGLGGLVNEIEIEQFIPYGDIPHFPVSTVETHEGKLIVGQLGGKKVIAMQGRFHFYEGYSMKQITLPVRVMKKLGIRTLLISNAAGGMNPEFRRGDLMIITDHINLLGDNPLIGPNLDEFGPRFPAMNHCYDSEIRGLIVDNFQRSGDTIKTGVYAALTGPGYESGAEIGMLKTLGADAVGMSTVPEAMASRHGGQKVAAISLITNSTGTDHVPTHQEVVDMAAKRRETLHNVILNVIADSKTV